jgi:exodeoxyribonuclease VII small subunit
MTRKKKDSLKYGEARQKLEEILKRIEGNEVDVDDLAEQVKEAAQLIQLCRTKLQKTRQEVEKVVSEMDLDEEEEVSEAGQEDKADSNDTPF